MNNLVEKYVNKVYDAALEVSREKAIPMSFLLAVSGLESSWGLSEGAVYHNAYFNIKQKHGVEPCYKKYVKEFNEDGSIRWETCKFRGYSSIKSSFLDFANFIIKSPRYAFYSSNYKLAADALQRGGYATEPEYAEKIIDIIEREGLDKYDFAY